MGSMRFQPQGLSRIRGDLLGRVVGANFTNNRLEIGGSGAEVSLFGNPELIAGPGSTLGRRMVAAGNNYAAITPPEGLVDLSHTTPYAVVCVFIPQTLGVASRILSYRHALDNNGIQLGCTSANRLGFWYGSSSGSGSTRASATGFALESGVTCVAVFGWDGAPFLYINGALHAGTSAGTFVTSNAGANTDINIARRNNGSSYFDGSVLMAAHIRGSVDGVALSLNPWQIFADPRDEEDLKASAVSVPNSYTLTAAPAAFGLSGSPAAVTVSRKLAGENGSFSLTGNAAALRAGRRVASAAGVITLTGRATVLAVSRKVTAAPGAFALAGQNASLMVARRLAAAAGAFTLAGGHPQLVYSPVTEGATIVTSSGQFVLSGSAVAMRVTRRLHAQAGSFVHAGAAAAIRYSRRMSAASGAFVAGGGAGQLRAARRLGAGPGQFDLAGGPASLAYASTVEYARAPAGSGYAPQRNEYQARPVQAGDGRPSARQENYR